MKSIIHRLPSAKFNSIVIPATFVVLALTCNSSVHSSPSCGLYGAPPCRYLPAPPGQTPACARPGKTYCEHIDSYPTYLIKHLVHKWGYEAKNLLVDETWDEFHALSWHGTPHFYDPAFIFPPKHPAFNENQNNFAGYDYDTPHINENFQNSDEKYPNEATFVISKKTTPTPTFLFYSSAGQHLNKNGYNSQNKINTSNNPTYWLKRIVRDLSHSKANHSISTPTAPHSPRDVSLNMDFLEIMGIEREHKNKKERVKRQSPGRNSLCQTTSQFVAPQAALNNKGNWMFVVNEPSSARQLVKAELCASNTCSNLCQLPTGYNSRCEQKFAQKRLIALQANGQNLYTDTFWFPSCCVCTISGN